MKKCFFALVSLLIICSANISASESHQVDLQIANAFFLNGKMMVIVQNNGPDIFDGEICVSSEGKEGTLAYAIAPGSSVPVTISGITITLIEYNIVVDPKNVIKETKEFNNGFSFSPGVPKFQILNHFGTVEEYFRDTLYVLPGEYFRQNLGSIWEVDGTKCIIGVKTDVYSSVSAVCEQCMYRPFLPISDPDLLGGTLDVFERYGILNFTWMANGSWAARSSLPLGEFHGVASKDAYTVGDCGSFSIYLEIAINNLDWNYSSMEKVIKKTDRIRCDVNDDGKVDYSDLAIMNKVVCQGLFNPYYSFEGLNTKSGLNYGAGIILFSQPDFVSNCLLNIWLNDETDPLVQGLGIGKMMSAFSDLVVENVSNTTSFQGDELIIDAPSADIYNVTANLPDGTLFQATGKMGETVNVPDLTLNYRVETVRLNSPELVTALSKEVKGEAQFYSSKDELRISGSENGMIKIFDLSGRLVQTVAATGNEQSVDISNYKSGLYIVKTKTGQTFKFVK